MDDPLSALRPWLAGAAIMTALCAYAPSATAGPPTTTRDELISAVRQPLTDFNINQIEIPDSLRKAAHAPYAHAPAGSCEAIALEIADLDEALGPDLDLAAEKTTKRKLASRAAMGAVRRLSSSWIPYRGVLRTVTGAEAHARKVSNATLAGAVRRAYLKGLGERDNCGPTAAPWREPIVVEAVTTDPAPAPATLVALQGP